MATNNALQNTFRTDFAESLIQEFSANSDDQYFVFFGKIDGWTVDTTPDTLVDCVDSGFSSIRNSYGIKRIDRTNLFYVVARYDWISGAVYEQYDDTVDMSDKQFYVMTDEYNLYKCIENGGGSKSTSKPTHTEVEIKASGDDGYKWKYLGKVTETARTFLTRDFIPVEYVVNADEDENSTQLISQRAAVNGAIDKIIVTKSSSNQPYSLATPLGESNTIKKLVYGSSDPEVVNGNASAGYTLEFDKSVIAGYSVSDNLIGMDVLTVSGRGPEVGQIRRVVGYTEAGETYTDADEVTRTHINSFVEYDSPFNFTVASSNTTPTEFRFLPPADIFGDGSSCVVRTEVDDDLKITSVIPISRGKDYTKAWIQFPMDPTNASQNPFAKPTARVVIGPKGGHGSNPVKELQANKVMIVLSVNRDEEGKLRTANEYRQFGIIKNPNLNSLRYGITAGKAGLEFKRQTKLRISKPHGIKSNYSYVGENETYKKGNYIIGEESFSTARIVDWYPDAGGTGNGNLIVESIQGNLVQGSLVGNFVRYVFGPSFGNATNSGRTEGAGGNFIVGATVTQHAAPGWVTGYAGETGATAEGIVESWDSVHRELVIKVLKNSFSASITAGYVRQPVYDGNIEILEGASASYWAFDGDTRFENKGGELIKQFTVESTAEGIYGGTSGYVTIVESTADSGITSQYHAYGRVMGIGETEVDENLNPVYTTTTKLQISSVNGTDPVPTIASGIFAVDSGLTQDAGAVPFATGKVLQYVVKQEGATQGDVYLTDVVGTFVEGDMSTNTVNNWEISEVEHPEIDLTSGEVLYIQNIRPISRSIEQDEEYKIVIGF